VSDGFRRVRQVLLIGLVAGAAQLGVWASVSPRAWYDNYPGFGRHWVDVDGPYNEHLVRDVGALYLALALLSVVALVKFTPVLIRTAAGAWLISATPHLIYHLRHLDPYGTGDKIGNAFANTLTVTAPLLLLLLTRSGTPESRPEPLAAPLENVP